jgi:hypothetical protein
MVEVETEAEFILKPIRVLLQMEAEKLRSSNILELKLKPSTKSCLVYRIKYINQQA